VAKYQNSLKRAYEMGNQIGSHTYSHSNLYKLEKNKIKEEMVKTNTEIKKLIGENVKLLRPPYGNIDLEMKKITVCGSYKFQKEMKETFRDFTPGKTSLLGRIRRTQDTQEQNAVSKWTRKRDCSCYICQGIQETFDRYLDTFFYLYRNDEEFRTKIKNGQGFCLHHFGILCDSADRYLKDTEKAEF